MGDQADMKYKSTSLRDKDGNALTVENAVRAIGQAFKMMQAMWEVNLAVKAKMDTKSHKFAESDGETSE